MASTVGNVEQNSPVKFSPVEKAHLVNAIDQYISLHQRNQKSAKVKAVSDAHAATVKELQDLFVKVRQNF